MSIIKRILAAFLPAVSVAGGAWAQPDCGTIGDPCSIAGGEYYVALPEGVETPPVFVYLHGFGSDREKRIERDNFVRQVVRRGYALVLPIGQEHPLMPGMDIWGIEDRIDWVRDDTTFLEAVLADAVERFGLNGERILFTGFSRGASMVWKFACERPEAANGFVSVSGVFWEPMPETCAGPIHLLHFHNFGDNSMPLEGHERYEQGERFATIGVLRGIEFWRDMNGCPVKADRTSTDDSVWTKAWLPESCWGGSVTFKLGPGRHAGPPGWIDDAIDWFEAQVP